MKLISASFKGLPCEVYFFKSWSTYTHPVTPTWAMEYEEALNHKGYYRAWICKVQNEDLLLYFEGIENKKRKTDILVAEKDRNKLNFYEYNISSQGLGRELVAREILDMQSFYVSLPGEPDYYYLVSQKKGIIYEYKYDDAGKLDEAIITDFDGNVKTLNIQ